MDRINDLAFVIEGRLVVLIEHQSTVCHNMPLRLLLYIARVYERLADREAMYRSKLIKLPRPEFYVLYNGSAPMPEKMTMRLSDAFIDLPAKFSPLELEVDLINVNAGNNRELVGKSENLSGYVIFIEKIKEYLGRGSSLEESIEAAVKFCVESGMLVDFLDRNSREVRNMLFDEFKMDVALDVRFKEGREEGLEQGLYIGAERATAKLAARLFSLGVSPEQIADDTGLPIETVLAMNSQR